MYATNSAIVVLQKKGERKNPKNHNERGKQPETLGNVNSEASTGYNKDNIRLPFEARPIVAKGKKAGQRK